nr:MAG TPA: hypothetical protein [Caudoviricetes sp.]
MPRLSSSKELQQPAKRQWGYSSSCAKLLSPPKSFTF